MDRWTTGIGWEVWPMFCLLLVQGYLGALTCQGYLFWLLFENLPIYGWVFYRVLPDLGKYWTLRGHHIFKEGIWLYRYRSLSERQHSGAVKGMDSGARLPGSDYSSSAYQLSNSAKWHNRSMSQCFICQMRTSLPHRDVRRLNALISLKRLEQYDMV